MPTLASSPLSTPEARPWWLARLAVGLLTSAGSAGVLIAVLTAGLTPAMSRLLVVLVGVCAVAGLARRWLAWRAWSEVPGGWWSRAAPRRSSALETTLRCIDLAGLAAVITAWLAATTHMLTVSSLSADPRALAWSGWTAGVAIVAPLEVVLAWRRRRCAHACALSLALVVVAIMYTPMASTIREFATGSVILAAIWRFGLVPLWTPGLHRDGSRLIQGNRLTELYGRAARR